MLQQLRRIDAIATLKTGVAAAPTPSAETGRMVDGSDGIPSRFNGFGSLLSYQSTFG